VPFRFLLVAVSVLLAAFPVAAQEIRMENGMFVVARWNPSATFEVFAGTGDVPPLLGSQHISDGRLIFTPRFPLAPGMMLRAVLREPGKPAHEVKFETPRRKVSLPPRVLHMYPSVDVLPANQLKLYIGFSAPMARGEAWRRLHLIDDKGARVEVPFLEIEQELWDPEGMRLTVLFDPGRIKRGLASLDEEGPALEEGRAYSIQIDREWRDAQGTPLERGFEKRFRVGAQDREPPETSTWRINSPPAGTTEPLIVRFPEPMDYALLLRLLNVPGVEGKVLVGGEEKEWQFTPAQPWHPGRYELVADTWLEDLAGNRLGRPFDLDTFERVTKTVERKTVSLPFRISGK
jgi:hypothetical protein